MKFIATTIAALATGASAQAIQHTAVTDDNGFHIQHTSGQPEPVSIFDMDPRGGNLLWSFVDGASITESVALGDAGNESWVAHALNDERISKFTTTGTGTPDFFYSLLAENPGVIGIDAAANGSLCAVISWASGSTIRVRAFSATGGNTPLWTYTFDASYNNSGKRAIAVSADGSRVAFGAYDGTKTFLVQTDAAGNVLNTALFDGFSSGIEMSADGSRILVTNGAVARLYDAATMTEVYNLPVSGSGGYARISADGTAIADGGFNLRAAREISGTWQVVHNGSGSQSWFGAVALSGDGTTLFSLSHNYAAGYLPNEHRVIDLLTGTVLATSSYTGTGSFQNSVVKAEANADGTIFACASWGDEGNTQPEVRIYDRDLNLIGSIDTPGSPFELDMSPDGQYVLVGSKAVHANTFGNGGRTYAYDNGSPCAADLNGDGNLNFFDVQLFLDMFAANNLDVDFNNDTVLNFFDVQIYLNLFGAGCS